MSSSCSSVAVCASLRRPWSVMWWQPSRLRCFRLVSLQMCSLTAVSFTASLHSKKRSACTSWMVDGCICKGNFCTTCSTAKPSQVCALIYAALKWLVVSSACRTRVMLLMQLISMTCCLEHMLGHQSVDQGSQNPRVTVAAPCSEGAVQTQCGPSTAQQRISQEHVSFVSIILS